MSTWPATAAHTRAYLRGDPLQEVLSTAGYRLIGADQGGVWLVGPHGSQWFGNWQAAAQSVADGSGALVKLEARISK